MIRGCLGRHTGGQFGGPGTPHDHIDLDPAMPQPVAHSVRNDLESDRPTFQAASQQTLPGMPVTLQDKGLTIQTDLDTGFPPGRRDPKRLGPEAARPITLELR